jgi:cell division protein FtsA
MAEILRARLEDLLIIIQGTIRQSGYQGLLPAGVVFTGGTAKLPGLVSVTEQVLGIPARIGTPSGLVGLVDALYDTAYATSVGLLLWAIRYGSDEDDDSRGSAVSEFLQQIMGMFGRRG